MHLVSVVTDDHVAFLVADGESVEQVAQVVNRGLDVRGVVALGTVLVDALGLNGTAVVAQPERIEPVTIERRVGHQLHTSWGMSAERALVDLKGHAGTTYRSMAQRLTGTQDARAVQAVAAHVGILRKRGHRIESETRGGFAHLTYRGRNGDA